MGTITFTLVSIVIMVACAVLFVYLVAHHNKDKDTKLTNQQARELKDSLHAKIQEQEAARLLLIERENKDVELDKNE